MAVAEHIGAVILSLISMGIGLYSHYDSDWSGTEVTIGGIKQKVKPYEVCAYIDSPPIREIIKRLNLEQPKCPAISMEKYFISMVIIVAIFAVLGLIIQLVRRDDSAKATSQNVGPGGIVSILLLAAGIVYIVSAVQIHNLVGFLKHNDLDYLTAYGFQDELFEWKIAAGVLAILHSGAVVVLFVLLCCGLTLCPCLTAATCCICCLAKSESGGTAEYKTTVPTSEPV